MKFALIVAFVALAFGENRELGGHTGSAPSSPRPDNSCGTEWEQGCACYGAGGGHGSWTCGSSKTLCTAAGGVASYKTDYKSSRSGCCMCAGGCTNEPATCTTAKPPNAPAPPSSSDNTGMIIGIAAGGAVGLIIVGFLVYKFVIAKPAAAAKA